jgi:hypothetical protein
MKLIIPVAVAVTFVVFARASVGDAELQNFDAKHRVAGEYYVVFRPSSELANVPRSGPAAPNVSPGIVPDSEKTVRLLGEALAKSVGARFGGAIVSNDHMAFIVKGAAEQDIRRVLARDPRIANISPSIEVTVD